MELIYSDLYKMTQISAPNYTITTEKRSKQLVFVYSEMASTVT